MSVVDTQVRNTMNTDRVPDTEPSIEGQLSIDIFRQSSCRSTVSIRSSRPLQASKLLLGKTPHQALSIIPLLYSVCGIAQTRAAIACLEQSLDTTSTSAIDTARDMLVLVENAKEHLFRLFIDWPRLFDLRPDAATLPYISQMIGEFKAALFRDAQAFDLDSRLNSDIRYTDHLIDRLEHYLQTHVFHRRPNDWLNIADISELHRWAQQTDSIAARSIIAICEQGLASQGQVDCPHLPDIEDEELLTIFETADVQQFIEQPRWQGHSCETTVLSRQYKLPLIQSLQDEFQTTLITRSVARLVELASIPQQLRELHEQLLRDRRPDQPPQFLACRGIKQVEAARGRLIHHVKLDDGCISDYRILAPTEWNFHPDGPAAQSLQTLANSKQNDIEQVAHLLINSIDPCVGYQLRVH